MFITFLKHHLGNKGKISHGRKMLFIGGGSRTSGESIGVDCAV